MFDLIITGLDEANTIIEMGYPTRIVSLVGPKQTIIHRGDEHLIVIVDDVIEAEKDVILPCKAHLETVLNFTADLTDKDILLVHCMAGVSRSTAIASAILIQHGMPFYEALDYIQTIRDCLMPNQEFISLIDAHFDLKGKYVSHYVEWRRRNYAAIASARNVTRAQYLKKPGDIEHMKDFLRALKNIED